MSIRSVVAGLALAAVLGVAGCQSCWNRQACRPAIGGAAPYPAPAAVAADPNVPAPPAPTQAYSVVPGLSNGAH